jgi:threonylcarbamoyladenosine tRNA methylthiotransferase MtaB
MTVDTVSFGCRLNTLESEVMRRRAIEAGLTDAVLVNSCAVTQEAVRQTRQTIRRLRRERPSATLVVTGCAAQTGAEEFAAMNEVDLVLGNADKLTVGAYRMGGAKTRVSDIMAVRETAGHLVDGLDGHTRGFVEIQNGCDHRCTFCIIPYGRGNSRSVPLADLIMQIRKMVEAGHAEIVLTGVDITSYNGGTEGGATLGTLVQTILREIPELRRLRLSSIDTIEVDAPLLAAIAEEERLMPHFHLSLQSGDDMILKRMKRRHSREDAIRLSKTIRALRPDVVFGADIIAGFPTESQIMFENSVRLIEDCDLTFLHVFPYSPRAGTPAARMPAVDASAIKDRAARLREAGRSRLDAHLDREVGTTRQVLVERGGTGRTEHFTPVTISGAPVGSIVPVRIAGRTETGLVAEALAEAA